MMQQRSYILILDILHQEKILGSMQPISLII